MKRAGIILLLLLACLGVNAQEKSLVKKGNELYQQKKYKEAAAAYQQALQKNPAYTPGNFNLGNSLIQQQQYDAARKVMGNAAKNTTDKMYQADASYNIGNTYMKEQKWNEAVDAYKQALRRNPQDADAKYNLSYALAKLKQENGGGKDKNKDKNKDDKNKDKDKKDQDKDKNKDKNDKDKDQDKKDQDKQGDQDKPQDGKDKEDKEQKRPEPQPSKLTQQQAENLLNALQQDERKLQDKVQKGKGVPVKTDKDW